MTATAPKNRRNRKAQDMAEATELKDILNQEPEKTVTEAAEYVGTTEAQLLEMFCERLSDGSVLAWHTVPTEHDPLLDEFKNLVAAEASVRRFDVPSEPQQLPPIADIPELPDDSQLQTTDTHSKKPSTALTEKKSKALKTSDQNAQKLASSDLQIKETLHARKGAKTGARLATLELVAEDATYRKIKGEALVRKVGQLTSEIAAESDFDPIQLLAELGIDSNSEIFADLKQLLEPALGKLDSATTEIVENAWVNGVDLEVELGNLEELLNSNDSTADYWQ
jgi:hypothetical protein